ncbi:hypothetical protein [Colwellia sp. 12G3]|uniref:hypothetical protein n=1 Tax=Colwellia sp. 12G3 TaxID=2058299 RepID=UPI000C34409A|nr:hypothetical protein [Colwellia sp. 12G3]PKI12721.1 hypothetical protein CXF71_18475 [Colwellia sp. 12G3]
MDNVNSPSDALTILARASSDVIAIAKEVGVDASALLLSLPASGVLLKGINVPVIHKKYRGTCSVMFYINQSTQGEYWPFLRFSTFKHGGLSCVFNGSTWLKERQVLNINTAVKLPRLCANKLDVFSENMINNNAAQIFNSSPTNALEDEKRLSRFINLQAQYRNAISLTLRDMWLESRLNSHATTLLLDRINVKRTANALLFPLYHDEHQHTGFHKIINQEKGDKKFHFAKKQGVFSGSYINIKANDEFSQLPIVLCEGVVTGMSLALVWPGEIRIALSANNLLPVRKNITKAVVIFCDEDVWKNKVGNVGRIAAMKAKNEDDIVRGPLFHFTSLGHKPTDFNDLLCLEGLSVLHKQVGDVLVESLYK